MTFTIARAENNYGPAKFIVGSNAAYCTHTTLAAAITAASSGDTIFLRDNVSESITLKSGVNIVGWTGAEEQGFAKITGKITASHTGTGVVLANLTLENSGDNFLLLSSANATSVILENCYLSVVNNVGISVTNSNAASFLQLNGCTGNIATSSTYFSVTNAAQIIGYYCNLGNSIVSTTASTTSSGPITFWYSKLGTVFTTTSTGAVNLRYCDLDAPGNTTILTSAGTGTCEIFETKLNSGSAVAISVGTGTTVRMHGGVLQSSNANNVSGLGTFEYQGISQYYTTGGDLAATTTNACFFRPGISRSQNQPCFSANPSTDQTNCTGDGTTVTITLNTEVFDVGANFASNTFTAPYTGKYQLNAMILSGNIGAAHTIGQVNMVTSNRTYLSNHCSPAAVRGNTNLFSHCGAVLADVDAADTATVAIQYSSGTKVISVIGASTNTCFNGILVY